MIAAWGAQISETVFSGSMLLAIPLALLAGLVSFASPCVLPLVPGYVGYMSGMAGVTAEQAASGKSRFKVVWGVLLFVAGFTAVFMTWTGLFSAAGSFLHQWQDLIMRVLGVVVVLMGLAFLGFLPFLQTDRRLKVSPGQGLWGAPLLGVVFGLGWAPCIGPTMTAVIALGLDQGTSGRALTLTLLYSLGLGLPFLIAALGMGWSKRMMSFLRRHKLTISRFGGVMLILLGLALVTGLWGQFALWFQGIANSFVPVV